MLLSEAGNCASFLTEGTNLQESEAMTAATSFRVVIQSGNETVADFVALASRVPGIGETVRHTATGWVHDRWTVEQVEWALDNKNVAWNADNITVYCDSASPETARQQPGDDPRRL